jgi:hypothetical protein
MAKVKKMAIGGMGSYSPMPMVGMALGKAAPMAGPKGAPAPALKPMMNQRSAPAPALAPKGAAPRPSFGPMMGQAAMMARSPSGNLRGMFKEGGKVNSKSASSRADGCAQRGKTKGKVI